MNYWDYKPRHMVPVDMQLIRDDKGCTRRYCMKVFSANVNMKPLLYKQHYIKIAIMYPCRVNGEYINNYPPSTQKSEILRKSTKLVCRIFLIRNKVYGKMMLMSTMIMINLILKETCNNIQELNNLQLLLKKYISPVG